MQIISGDLKAKKIVNLSNVTHPMSEKIRGGLFNILGDINGLTFLDCYSGTGAVSFEAISRGAKSAVLVESDKKAQQSIVSNIKNLDVGSDVMLIKSSVKNFVDNYKAERFDVVLCDPPFDKPIDINTISRLETLVKTDKLLIISLPNKPIDFHFNSMDEIKVKIYGDARLVFFRRKI
jgi:16S rRNA (guanine966-N2)-methyltransferase